MTLLNVQNLSVSFYLRKGTVYAVQNVSFSLPRRQILGIVGESGCGKSTLCLALLKLIPEALCDSTADCIDFDGTDLQTVHGARLRAIRGNTIGMVFQDPAAALNPYMRVIDQVAEPMRVHKHKSKTQARAHALAALCSAGIANPENLARSYPHEFSGGMRQRAMIAMALTTEPKLLIADEPTTGLDVTIQAQIIALLKNLQKQRGMSIIFVTHDLGIVAGLCERVMVMYAGRVVESGTAEDLFYATGHPYTSALMKAAPAAHAPGEPLQSISGFPPDLSTRVSGCAFAPRCRFADALCISAPAVLTPLKNIAHVSACRRVSLGEISL